MTQRLIAMTLDGFMTGSDSEPPSGLVLSLCDRTGNMIRPWAEAGFPCITVDSQRNAEEIPNVTRIQNDVRRFLPPRVHYAVVFAFTPCTNLAVSGARWFKEKGLHGLTEALEVAEACVRICEWSGARWMLENPVSTLASYWRKPDYMFDPYDYGGYLLPGGDAYTKKTCLWTGGGFVMPEKRPVPPTEGSKMHRISPSPERADKRSETPMGFARAVFEANARR
jgi:hypothetical protein